MIISLSPKQDDILAALRVNFLQKVLPPGNAMFTGSIAGNTLTVLDLQVGTLAIGDVIQGGNIDSAAAVAAGTMITAGSGPSWTVSGAPQTVTSMPMASGVPVVLGQSNRVGEPSAGDFIVMWPIRQDRLSTNIDDYVDCYFQGSIAGTTLTIASINFGAVMIGSELFGVGVPDETLIMDQLTGTPGGAGTYQLNQSVALSSQGLACGTGSLSQHTQWTIQLDVHGPNSADYAEIISTTFRDEYGVTLLQESGLPIAPLYADNPRQVPFIDGESQYENRWVIEAVLQVNQTVVIPQEFAGALSVTLINVEAEYAP